MGFVLIIHRGLGSVKLRCSRTFNIGNNGSGFHYSWQVNIEMCFPFILCKFEYTRLVHAEIHIE